jgi:hypothetical protein
MLHQGSASSSSSATQRGPTLVPRSQAGLRVALAHAALGACVVLLVGLARAPADAAQRARGGAALAAQAALSATSRVRGGTGAAGFDADVGVGIAASASSAAARRTAAFAALSDVLAQESDALRAARDTRGDHPALLRPGGASALRLLAHPCAARHERTGRGDRRGRRPPASSRAPPWALRSRPRRQRPQRPLRFRRRRSAMRLALR